MSAAKETSAGPSTANDGRGPSQDGAAAGGDAGGGEGGGGFSPRAAARPSIPSSPRPTLSRATGGCGEEGVPPASPLQNLREGHPPSSSSSSSPRPNRPPPAPPSATKSRPSRAPPTPRGSAPVGSEGGVGGAPSPAALAALLTDAAGAPTVDAVAIIRLLLEDAQKQRQALLQACQQCGAGTGAGAGAGAAATAAAPQGVSAKKIDTLEHFARRVEEDLDGIVADVPDEASFRQYVTEQQEAWGISKRELGQVQMTRLVRQYLQCVGN
jgi:hypothetical protein